MGNMNKWYILFINNYYLTQFMWERRLRAYYDKHELGETEGNNGKYEENGETNWRDKRKG